jgi:MFS transporter, SP family, general alpha glucoside:H+ symporter
LTYYLQLGGYSTSDSFKINNVQQVLSLTGNVCSWFIIDRVDRRALTLCLASLIVFLFITGGLATVNSSPYIGGTVAMMWIWCFFYNMTIGATAYTLLTEIATARLRAKTAALGLARTAGMLCE